MREVHLESMKKEAEQKKQQAERIDRRMVRMDFKTQCVIILSPKLPATCLALAWPGFHVSARLIVQSDLCFRSFGR